MPIQHIVWFKAKDRVSAAELEDLHTQIRSLADTIPGALAISSGKNFTDRANGFTDGAIITLRDKHALDNYISHPIHVNVGQQLRAKTELMALDFEC